MPAPLLPIWLGYSAAGSARRTVPPPARVYSKLSYHLCTVPSLAPGGARNEPCAVTAVHHTIAYNA